MFHIRDRQTGELFDRWAHLGPKRRKLLDRSWAGLFRKEILPILPVEAIIPAFHARNGRPSKEIYTILGALVFQQMHDLTDEDAVRQLAFNMEWPTHSTFSASPTTQNTSAPGRCFRCGSC